MASQFSFSRNGALAALVLLASAAGGSSLPPQQPADQTREVHAQPEARAGVARFRTRLEAALGQSGANQGYWVALVADVTTGETLYALNAEHYFSPASNAKLASRLRRTASAKKVL